MNAVRLVLSVSVPGAGCPVRDGMATTNAERWLVLRECPQRDSNQAIGPLSGPGNLYLSPLSLKNMFFLFYVYEQLSACMYGPHIYSLSAEPRSGCQSLWT